MVSDKGKWSKYVHSCISSTHRVKATQPVQKIKDVTYGVNGTPFWAGNHTVDPERYGQPLRNEAERSHITLNYFCLIRLLLVFRF